jgi:ATP-dependent exoDNAse (exonuclease V) alpha subunit
MAPLTTSAWVMLQRNLLYTAEPRAQRLVALAGSRKTLARGAHGWEWQALDRARASSRAHLTLHDTRLARR